MRRWLILMAAGLALTGCSFGKDVPAVEKEIAAFHAALDRGQSAQIYAASAPDLKKTGSEADMVNLLDAVHRKLGRFKGGKTTGWNDNSNMSGHFLDLAYAATYEKGQAREDFVYRLGGARPALVGYHIASNALIEG